MFIDPSHDVDLVFTAHFDIDLIHAVTTLRIKSTQWQGNIKRNTVILRSQCFEVGTYLIGNITASCDSVSTGDHHINHIVLHEVSSGIVCNDGMVNSCIQQFP